MSHLTSFSLKQAREGLRKGEFSSEELVQSYLEKIALVDPDIGAYISWDEERALASAREADKKLRDGAGGPLCGVPIAVKDILNVKGTLR